jgi:saccharopine dehydrogenase-like NADP-dependent oxidoreductase
VAEDPSRPYGYVVTWSLNDLLEEYLRPARIIQGGKPVEVPAFSGLEHVHIAGVGEMEAFYSDGLRTLLETLPGVREMGEKTLRWPGHAVAVQPLVASGDLLDELRRHCGANPPRDLVVLVVRLRWGDTRREIFMVDRYDAKTGLTAMSRTTAFTTSVVAQLAARGGLREKGVQPLERVARDEKAYGFIVAEMESREVRFVGA